MRYYKWTLKSDKSMQFYDLFFDFENEFVKISRGVITVKAGYSWDGCTPKRKIGKFIIGTWDGLITKKTGEQQCYVASLFHDVMYQFKLGDRLSADQMFLDHMIDNEFIFSHIYYGVVRMFGWIQWRK